MRFFDLRDLHIYGGLTLTSVGAWLVMPAAGLIVAGVGLMYLALRN